MQKTIQLTMTSRWGVRLEGDAKGVANLARVVNGSVRGLSDLFCTVSGPAVTLRTREWDTLPDDQTVLAYATETLRTLSGALHYLDGTSPIGLGSIIEWKANGEATQSRLSTIMIYVTRAQPATPEEFRALLDLGQRHERLGTALALSKPPTDWFDIYKVIEALEDHFGGEKALLSSGLVSSYELKRVKQMANSFRHVGKVHRAPVPPVSLEDAKKAVRSYLEAVIQHERQRG